jgi:hypothetical protein
MPAIPPPPTWEQDDLSKFLQQAHNNQLVTAGRKTAEYNKLAEIDALFMRVGTHIINPKNMTAADLFYRTHAAYRAACGAATAGQVTEAVVLSRSCLEASAYALHIHEHPGHDMLWWDRNKTPAQKKAVIKTFAHGRLRETIAKHDKRLDEVYDLLYEQSIDYGGHPNQLGVAGGMSIADKPESDRISVIHTYLHADGLMLDFGLKFVARVGICALRLHQFMMPEKFKLLQVTDRIRAAEQGL